MKSQEVVVYAQAFKFTNDEGKIVESGEVRILDKSKRSVNDWGITGGHKVGKYKVPYEVAKAIVEKVPALCDIEYDININRDNAVTLVPQTITVVKEFKSLI